MTYEEFLRTKQQSEINHGFRADKIPSTAFDYQSHIIDKSLYKGRCANFLDTGTGKTLIQLSIADNIVRKTNKKVLILTPLAVAFQFIKEASERDITDDVEYSKNGKFTKNIVITNYERMHYFDTNDFECVMLDESSILKNFDGEIKQQITAFMRKTPYRFLSTATPSPNDYIELGTSSEALGYMGYMDMLSRFFKNNQNNVAKLSQISKARQGEEWYLKPHAEKDFWRWVKGWSITMRRPSDLGFSDDRFVLPELIEKKTIVNNKNLMDKDGQLMMFNVPAINFHDIKQEVRNTIGERCEMAVEKANNHETSVYWVNLNDEAKRISELDKTAYEIKGSMDIDKKEELLIAFSNGEIKKLITKTSITAFGLNWQHCNHTTYFPTYSYEQYYQAIRRFWRFGQKRPVVVDLVLSDGQTRIMESLQVKRQKADEMFTSLTSNVNDMLHLEKRELTKQITLPEVLCKAN